MCELARQVVWQCMLEDEYLFFQPLLDQFNKLYSYIKEDSHTKSAEIDKLMVRHSCSQRQLTVCKLPSYKCSVHCK